MEDISTRYISDNELIQNFKNGDSNSFTVLYNRYLPLVYKIKRKYYFQDVDSDDWKQEAWIVILKTIRHFDGNRGVAFVYYFKRNLRNRAFDIIRHENASKRIRADKKVNIDSEDCENSLMDSSNHMPDEWAICCEKFKRFFASCSPREKRIFVLIHQGKNLQEVADILHCHYRNVTGALDRCRKKLNSL